MNTPNKAQAICKNYQLGLLLAYLHNKNYRFTTISPASHKMVNNSASNVMAIGLAGIFGWSRPFSVEIVDDFMLDLVQTADIVIKVKDGCSKDCWISQFRVSSINHQLFLHSAYPTLNNNAVFFGPDTYRFANAIQQYLFLKSTCYSSGNRYWYRQWSRRSFVGVSTARI